MAVSQSKPAGPMGLHGTLTLPGDKSIGHRALILSSLCPGISRVVNLPQNRDVLATQKCLERLGLGFEPTEGEGLLVHTPDRLNLPGGDLDAENSGTTLRLLSGLLSAQNLTVTLTGDETLKRRPMERVIRPLREMGARIRGEDDDRYAPVHIEPCTGGLKPIDYTLPVASAQVKSALILAALFAGGASTIREPLASRDHTERMLQHLGVPLRVSPEGPGKRIDVSGRIGRTLAPLTWQVPGDVSSAAFFIVAALLVPGSCLTLRQVGLNPGRTGLIGALRQAGADIETRNLQTLCGEPVGDLVVRSSALKGEVLLNATTSPAVPDLIDELPILAVAGAFLEGSLEVCDAEELRKKESDRIEAVAGAFGKLGIPVTVFPDGFRIEGRPDRVLTHPQQPLSASQDHRMAMALTVLNRISGGPAWPIEGREWAEVSYPGFYEAFAGLEQPS